MNYRDLKSQFAPALVAGAFLLLKNFLFCIKTLQIFLCNSQFLPYNNLVQSRNGIQNALPF